jgi:hypothetical protein
MRAIVCLTAMLLLLPPTLPLPAQPEEDADQRLERIEDRLDQLLRDLDEGPPPPRPAPAPGVPRKPPRIRATRPQRPRLELSPSAPEVILLPPPPGIPPPAPPARGRGWTWEEIDAAQRFRSLAGGD